MQGKNEYVQLVDLLRPQHMDGLWQKYSYPNITIIYWVAPQYCDLVLRHKVLS